MRIDKRLKYWAHKAYGNETPLKIASVILYESADILKEQTRIDDYPDEETERNITIKTAIGDELAMTQLFCSMKGFDFYEMYMEGCQRAILRCKEKMQGMGGF